MTITRNPSTKRHATMAALLLLLATASGCGVLPTQPSVTSLESRDNTAVTTNTMNLDPLVIEGGAGDSGGGTGSDVVPPPVDPIREIVITPAIRPGNSEWGHSHKKPKN